MSQEPGSDQDILAFVRAKGAEFPVFSKTKVNGKQACDLFKYLRLNSNLDGGRIGWNFGKFVVSRDGTKIEYYGPRTDPLEVVQHFKKFL